MAVLCERYGLLFIGNPRTGSTAVGRSLVDRCDGRYVPDEKYVAPDGRIVSKRHVTLEGLVRYDLLAVDPAALLKFTAVRNPFDSIVSMYLKRRHRGRWSHTRAQREAQDLETFLLERYRDPKPRSMHGPYADGMDQVLRFESQQEGFEAILRDVGAPPYHVPRVNPTVQKDGHYRSYYTDRARELVEIVFAEDLERFGYSF